MNRSRGLNGIWYVITDCLAHFHFLCKSAGFYNWGRSQRFSLNLHCHKNVTFIEPVMFCFVLLSFVFTLFITCLSQIDLHAFRLEFAAHLHCISKIKASLCIISFCLVSRIKIVNKDLEQLWWSHVHRDMEHYNSEDVCGPGQINLITNSFT